MAYLNMQGLMKYYIEGSCNIIWCVQLDEGGDGLDDMDDIDTNIKDLDVNDADIEVPYKKLQFLLISGVLNNCYYYEHL